MIKKILLGVVILALVVVGGYFALGGREGLILLYANYMKETPAPNHEVVWQQGPDAPPVLAAGEKRKPNIIVILADDLGFNDVSFYGGGTAGGLIKTPNIDSIGKGGVNFPAGYAGNATCAPSRAALMTGRYATRFGYEFTPTALGFQRLVGNSHGMSPLPPIYHADREADVPDFRQLGLPLTETTIGGMLQKAGYHTIHLGKWHLGEQPEQRPEARGFDESLGFYAGASMFMREDDPDVVNSKQDFDPIDKFLWAALNNGVRYNSSPVFEAKGHMTDYLTDQAVAAIQANRNRPFFMYLAYNAVHTPLQATKEDYDALPEIKDHTLRVYAAMVRQLDRDIGKVLAELKAQGLEGDTLVIFTSDNGGAHYVGLDDLNKPYSGWKATFYEGGIRIPFFMRWPGVIPAGSTYAAPISHFDVFATAAGAAGEAVPADRKIDGVNLLPFLTGGQGGEPHQRLFWRSGPYVVVREGDWKLQVDGTQKLTMLYDLATDPAEKTNLADRNPEKVAALQAEIADFQKEQVKPLWPALMEGVVPIDHPLNRPWGEKDRYIYWSN
ncbi:Arylsulfatase [Alphaproteobacteria bacterium SO-S41]|nr:Arylsulfatase [Alphaproteobacteria bacterium SO-S41]